MLKITGSKNHELYEKYKDIISKFNDQQLLLLKEQLMGSKGNKNYSAEEKPEETRCLIEKEIFIRW